MQQEHLEILLESIDSKFQVTLTAFQSLNHKIDARIDELRDELKQDISVVDCNVMGLSKRLDGVENRLDNVEERLSLEITAVRIDLAAHRNKTELHKALPKRPLKRA